MGAPVTLGVAVVVAVNMPIDVPVVIVGTIDFKARAEDFPVVNGMLVASEYCTRLFGKDAVLYDGRMDFLIHSIHFYC